MVDAAVLETVSSGFDSLEKYKRSSIPTAEENGLNPFQWMFESSREYKCSYGAIGRHDYLKSSYLKVRVFLAVLIPH